MTPWTIELAKWQERLLTINPAYKERLDFKADGKSYTPAGLRVPKGTTVTARKVNDHTIELVYKLKGKRTETDQWQLSTNGKTLTQTISYAGVNTPEVDVYNRL